jgi:hypothetical protein
MTGELNPDRSNHTNRIVSYATMHILTTNGPKDLKSKVRCILLVKYMRNTFKSTFFSQFSRYNLLTNYIASDPLYVTVCHIN